jgi:hypothetical protein
MNLLKEEGERGGSDSRNRFFIAEDNSPSD